MYRVIAFLLSLAVGGLAGWQVYINLDEIVSKWLVTIGISAGVVLGVTLILYLPLLRHIADLIEEHFSTLKVRVTSRKTGVDLDAIPRSSMPPRRTSITTTSNKALCSICGGPGGPICDSCHAKMSSK
jgi:hypothetical protein